LKISGGSVGAEADGTTGGIVDGPFDDGVAADGAAIADRATPGWLEAGWLATEFAFAGTLAAGFGDVVCGICAEVFAAGGCEAFAGARGLALSGRGCSTRGLSGAALRTFLATSGGVCSAARAGALVFEAEELASGLAGRVAGRATEFGFGICCCAGESGAVGAIFSALEEIDGATVGGLLASAVFLSNMCNIWFRVAGPAANHPATNEEADAMATMAKTFLQLVRRTTT
jgi:hypothetical protein